MDISKLNMIRLVSSFDAITRDMSDGEIIAGTAAFLACVVRRAGMPLRDADEVVAEAHKIVSDSLAKTEASVS